MKKYASFLGFAIGFIFFGAAITADAQTLPKTSFKVVGLQSHLNSFKTGEKPFWEKTIPEASGGAITGEITPQDLSGLQGPEILRLMKLGVIDLASGVIGYMSGDNPEFDGVDITGLSPDMKTTRATVDAYMPALQEVMANKYNAKLFMIFPSPPQVIWCRKPVTSVADLSGKSVRVFNTSMAELVKGLGGSPVTMPFGEVTTSLERGVIDCAITGTLSGNTARMFEVTTHLFGLYMGWSVHFTAISLASWNKLTPAGQAFLTKQYDELNQKLWDTVAKEAQDGIDCSIGKDPCVFGFKGKMTYTAPSSEDLAKSRKIVEEVVLPNWAKRCGEKCTTRWLETAGKAVGVKTIAAAKK
jgi:TRAP-type C4-dicarboxylate transport system substrate-binding protein